MNAFVHDAKGSLLLLWLCVTAHASTVERQLPSQFGPSNSFEVSLLVLPDGGTRVFAVEDEPPAGWIVSDINHSGAWDARQNSVKWGPFFDDTARRLRYRVTPPGNAETASFHGRGVIDGNEIAVTGSNTVAAPENSVVCAMAEIIQPGAAFAVVLTVAPVASTALYAVEDQPPAGWAVGVINEGGVFDARHRKVKWGPFLDNAPRMLTYQVTPILDAAGTNTFSGSARFGERGVTIVGQRSVIVATSSATRKLPSSYVPGVSFMVTNIVAPRGGVRVYAVQDQLSEGWFVANINEGGVFDAASRRVKWGPFFDALPRMLEYTVTVPLTDSADSEFRGTVVFDNVELTIGGDTRTALASGAVVRSLPDAFVPGVSFVVTDDATPAPQQHTYAVEDSAPPGWTVTNITHNGVFDARNGKVKWGPFRDNTPRSLRFRVTPPPDAGPVTFSGQAIFDEESTAIAGQRDCVRALSRAERQLPLIFQPGQPFTVRYRIEPTSAVHVYSVEDLLPSGWAATNIGDGGVFDPATCRVKWGPFFDSIVRILQCRITPPSGAVGKHGFSGTAVFDDSSVVLGGPSEITRAINTAPIADSQYVTTAEEIAVGLTLTGSSIYEVPLAFVLVAGPAKGMLSGTLPNLIYTPTTNFSGEDSFTFRVNDGTAISADAAVRISVIPVNDSPSISDVPNQTIPQGESTPRIPFVIGDVETPAATLAISVASSNPALVANSNIVVAGTGAHRTVRLAPASSQSGAAIITVTVTDADGASGSDTFILSVQPPVTHSFTNSDGVIIPALGAASTYPSTITVAGLTGTVTKATASLANLNHTNPDDLDVLLVSPGGRKVLLMSDAGGAPDMSNLTLTFDDTAADRLPNNGPITAGTFKPSSFENGDVFPAPAPSGPYSSALSAFNTFRANGTWSLYLLDDLNPGAGNVDGWTLTLIIKANSPPSISDIMNRTIFQDATAVTIPFTVLDAETAANLLNVTVDSSNPTLFPAANLVLGGSGANRTLTLAPAAGEAGTATITVTAADAEGAVAIDVFELVVTPLIKTTFADATTITIPANGPASPYPSSIAVAGLTETIQRVAITLSGLSHTAPDHLDVLLIGPGGQKVLVMSDAGGSGALTNVDLTFNDAASASLPNNRQIVTGTFKPTNFGTGDTFPAPAPVGPYATALAAFNGVDPNGTWLLNVIDDQSGEGGTIASGWSLAITTVPSATQSGLIPASLNGESFLSFGEHSRVDLSLAIHTVERIEGETLLIIIGPGGRPCVVEAAIELSNWSRIGEIDGPIDADFLEFVDREAGIHSHRFYRVRAE